MNRQKLTPESCHKYSVLYTIFAILEFLISIPIFTLSLVAGGLLFLLGVFLLIFASALRSQEKQLKAKILQEKEKAKELAAQASKQTAQEAEREAYKLQRQQKEEFASAVFSAIPRVPIEQVPYDENDNKETFEYKHTSLTARSNLKEFVVVDTETTGLNSKKDRIIELAAVRFVDGHATEMFDTLVNPGKPIPKEASSVNQITDETVADSPSVDKIISAFDNFIGKSTVVGHNLDFDIGFILSSGSRINQTKRKYYCTLEIAKRMLKKPRRKWDKEFQEYVDDFDSDWDVENYKLGTLCEYYGIVPPCQHRAGADAFVTGQLLLCMFETKKSQ